MPPAPLKQRALEQFQKGRLKKARELYEKACRQNPDDAEAWYMLGSVYGQAGAYDMAVKHLTRAAKLQPAALPVQCALGAAYKALGKLDEAEHCFRRALDIKPDFHDARLELAGILMNREKFGEAEELLRAALKAMPNNAAALHGLGEIRHARRDLEGAIQYYQQALKAAPNRPETHNRLGFALHTLGRLEEAIEHYRKAVALKPDFATAYKNLGSTLMTAGRLDEADEAFVKALDIDPGFTDAIVSRASLLEKRNDPQGAYDILAPLLKRGVLHPGIGICLADICPKLERCEEAAGYLEDILAQPEIPEATREQMHYALGKLYDRLGRHDEAFRHFRKANDLKPANFSAAEHHAITDAIIRTFDSSFMQHAPRASVETSRPIFIVGMPRSGTSLTEQILSRHDAVFGAGELLTIGDLATGLCQRLGPEPGFPQCFAKVSQPVLDELARAYLGHLESLDPDSPHVTDKMPQNFIYLGLIALAFPQSRVIHCIRDPRDTCLSIYFQHFNESHGYATDLENLGHYYLAYQRLMDHWKKVLDIPILDVHYETLIDEQEATTRKMLDFLGLEWDPRCLRFHEADRFVATSSYDQVRRPLYKTSMARWKRYERHLGPLLDVLGMRGKATE